MLSFPRKAKGKYDWNAIADGRYCHRFSYDWNELHRRIRSSAPGSYGRKPQQAQCCVRPATRRISFTGAAVTFHRSGYEHTISGEMRFHLSDPIVTHQVRIERNFLRRTI